MAANAYTCGAKIWFQILSLIKGAARLWTVLIVFVRVVLNVALGGDFAQSNGQSAFKVGTCHGILGVVLVDRPGL